MSTHQYDNRQIDYLVAIPQASQTADQRVELELFSQNNTGHVVTGVKKLAQRWLIEFTTKTGTLTKLPDRGSEFMREAFSGKFRSGLNIRHEFAKASAAVKKNLIADETAAMPLDERFASAELLSFNVTPTTVVNENSGTSIIYLNMRIKINSLAGDAYETILPVPTIPRGVI